jgi:AcrR family transcriptional regulator
MAETVQATRRRRRTQSERRAETRASVLAAARTVFARRGLRGASLEEIAEEAGVSRGAVYYNFDDKEHLFLALLRERCLARAERLHGIATDSDEIGTELRRVATAFMEASEREPEWTRLFSEFTALAAERPELRAELADELAECRDAVATILERRLRELGVTSTMPMNQLAAVASAVANGLALEREADPALPHELLAQTVELIIAGLRATEQGAGRR